MNRYRGCVSLLLLALAGCGSGTASTHEPIVTGGPDHDALMALALPAEPSAPADASNHWADDAQAAAFGQRLFFEPGFSGRLLDGDNDGSAHALGNRNDTGKVACAGCHLPAAVFADSRSLRQQISLAAGWGKRRAPSLLDVAQSKLLMWDGRRDALYNQVFGVIESPVEMNSSRLFAAERVFALHRAEYESIFGPLPALDQATEFPALAPTSTGCSELDQVARTCKGEEHGIPGDGAEYDHLSATDQTAVTQVVVNVGKALGAYERLLSCGTTRFDQWLSGQADALDASEQRGAALFVGKGKCVSCHSGPYLSDEKFHNVGLQPTVVATVFIDADDPGASVGLAATVQDQLNVHGQFSDGDDGRDPVTVDASALGAFRTPKLRCVAGRPSFMHTGQFSALSDVVAFFSRGGDEFGYPGTNELVALNLSADERADLVAFLGALSGPGPRPELLSSP